MSKKRKSKKQSIWQFIASAIILICIIVSGYISQNTESTNSTNEYETENITFDLSTIPEYSSNPCVEINNGIPYFTEEEYSTDSFEKYSNLDQCGRCGVAFANICKETMPPDGDERGNIGSVTPTGWKQKKYDGEFLYHRCHLIAYQLSDEDANKQNLMTGTKYLNINGMLPFENQVAEYIRKNQNNHVLYRVTPIFEGNNLVASGVQMEGWSVEDEGQGVHFNVYCYNVQPGIVMK